MKYLITHTWMLYSLLIFSPMISAKHVLPVFSGKWYTDCKLVMDQDSCSQPQYAYNVFIKGAAMEVASILLSNLPKRGDCEWQKIFLTLDWPFSPRDFSRVGNENDWDAIFQQKLGPNPQVWERWCISSESHGLVDIASVNIQPFYECPAKARYDYLDLDDKVKGCSTHPTLCNADIVGRDIDSSSDGNAVGHVGLATYPQNVLEVLGDKPVIQLNPLDDFRKKTAYWGAKYGLAQAPILTVDQSYNIVLAAYKQRDCKTVTYTPTWNWHACQIDPDTGEENAVFRCDSFVYYGYVAGADIKILDYKFGVLPIDLFNQFLGCRFNQGDIGGHCSGYGSPIEENLIYYKMLIASLRDNQSLQEESIRSILVRSRFDIKNLDTATYHYATDIAISRPEKINFLWQLAKEYQTDEARFNYIIDCLKYFKPVELTDSLISEFYAQTDLKNQKCILQLLGELAGKSALKIYPTMKLEVKNDIIEIHNFYNQLLQSAADIDILETAILFYPTIFTPEQALQDIEKVFNRVDIDTNALQDKLSLNPSYFTGQLSMIFSNQELQKQFLPKLLEEVKFLDIQRRNVFNESLYNYFNDADFYPPKIGFDASNLSDDARSRLTQYLKQQQPMVFTADHLPDFSPTSLDGLHYNWLETYVAVQAHDYDEKYSKLANYIKSADNLSYKSLLLFYATKKVYDQFSCEDMRQLIGEFNNSARLTNDQPKNWSSEMQKQAELEGRFNEISLPKIKRFLNSRCK